MESSTYSPDKKSCSSAKAILRTQKNLDDFISEKICFIKDALWQRA
jgi:hypothetical protein